MKFEDVVKKSLRALLTVAILSTPLTATGQKSADFTYTSSGSTIAITGYTGGGGVATIPSSIDGLPVTTIRAKAFTGCTNVVSVVIPAKVTSIELLAFDGCTSLEKIVVESLNPAYASMDGVLFDKKLTTLLQYPAGKSGSYTIPNSVNYIGAYAAQGCTLLAGVTFPDSLNTIGRSAFNLCTSLTGVTIPARVTGINGSSFSGCYSLKSISVDANNSAYASVYGVLFDKKLTTLMQYPAGKAGSYRIPDGVIAIDEYAAQGCVFLIDITIPDSVAKIRMGAFNGCANLTKVFFEGNAPSAGEEVFYRRRQRSNRLLSPQRQGVGTNLCRTVNGTMDGAAAANDHNPAAKPDERSWRHRHIQC